MATPPEITLGWRLRIARSQTGHTATTASREVLTTRQRLEKWERDQEAPPTDKLLALAELYDVPAGWLLTGETVIASTADAAA